MEIFEKIEEIHLSFVNGQKKQAIEQIQNFGERDFFAYYTRMLHSDYCLASAYNYLADAINTYFRIVNNTI